MILKNADDKSQQLRQLEEMLTTADPSFRQRIEHEIRVLRAGIKGEKESAYEIDFHFKNSKSTVVIHDLRLEVNDRIAQIDHLVIQRFHRFYVLETKHFAHGLKINECGEFLRWNDWRKVYEGMPSPVEQNNKHAAVLRDALSQVGMKRPAAVVSFVLVSPSARIDRGAARDVPEVVKADQFFKAYDADLDASIETAGIKNFGTLARVAFGATAEEIGRKLIAMHRPITVDYSSRFAAPNKTAFSRRASDRVASSVQAPVSVRIGAARAESAPKCKACSSADLKVEYGQYGYYFKCQKCSSNTAIKIGCGIDGHKERIRKRGNQFFRECSGCGSSSVFFENVR
jgi:hypothetical protein